MTTPSDIEARARELLAMQVEPHDQLHACRIRSGSKSPVAPIPFEQAKAALVAALPKPDGEMLPADVVRLVIAARSVAFEDADADAIRELDAASEAFADRVTWENEPSTPESGPAIGEGEHRRCPWCRSPASVVHLAGLGMPYRAGCANDACEIQPVAKGLTIADAWFRWDGQKLHVTPAEPQTKPCAYGHNAPFGGCEDCPYHFRTHAMFAEPQTAGEVDGPFCVYSEPEVGLPPTLFEGRVGETGFGPVNLDDSRMLYRIADALNVALAHPSAVEREVCRTEAAGRIIDIMSGGRLDWRVSLDESDFLESADWMTALAYADAALTPAPSVEEGP